MNSVADFTLFYVMPLNKKMIPFVPKGTLMDEARFKKMLVAGELLVHREEIGSFKKYLETHVIQGAAGLQSRCRAHYMHFCKSHMELVFLLSDQSELGSFQKGEKLFKYCEDLAQGLLTSLSSVEDPWEIVNNSSLGEFGSLERAPGVAAYSGVLSLMSGIGEPARVMVAALIADIGTLELAPAINRKIRSSMGDPTAVLTAEELSAYHRHPEGSLNICMSRKLQIDSSLRNMVMCSHERADGKGFPQRTLPEKISSEAMVIQFSQLVDLKSCVQMGQQKITAKEARAKIFEEMSTNKGIFSLSFLSEIKQSILGT